VSKPVPWLQPGVLIGGLAPLGAIAVRASQGTLSADPIARVENELGLAALVLLVASLACTPARRVLGWTWPSRIRRELGLLAAFYASLHFLTYLVLDQGLDLSAVITDIVKRPFITVGFVALVLLGPLVFTSTKESVRRLGFRRWQRIHQLVYVAGILAVIHFIWRVKIDVSQPLVYAFVLAVLLLVRVIFWLRQGTSTRSRGRALAAGRAARTSPGADQSAPAG
jgi:sulfoxide reductase heme-binding subunit YedZ